MKTNEPITDYAKLDPNASYSFLDYMRWQFTERVELIKGKLYKMSPAANTNHQTISSNFSRILGIYFLNKPCRVFIAPFDVRLFPKTCNTEYPSAEQRLGIARSPRRSPRCLESS